MQNPLHEIKEMLKNLDGLKEEEIKITVEPHHNIITVPRISTATYRDLKEIRGYGITEKFNKQGKAIEYNIFVRI